MARPTRAALALLCLAALAAGSLKGAAAAELNNTVTQWEALAQSAVRTMGIQSQLASRAYALVAIAQLKAIDANPSLDPSVAAAVAGHAVLSHLFPHLQSSAYDGALSKQLKALNAKVPEATLQSIASASNALVNDYTAGDSSQFPAFSFPKEPKPYTYQAAPNQKFVLLPQLANAKPVLSTQARLSEIASNKDASKGPVFAPPQPNGIDYDATRRLGRNDSTERTKYDTQSVAFWADGANTSAISGHFLNISLKVLPEDTSVRDTALFFARAAAAAWDAAIACWKVKYTTLHWRPITAFTQGYPAAGGGKVKAAEADPTWASLLPMTPPHPEYPSGHQCTVGAILEVLVRTLGTDEKEFSIGSEGTPAFGERTYKSLTAAANEVGNSRLYGGVHFNSSNVDGLKLGRLVASEVFDKLGGSKGSKDTKPAANAAPAAANEAPAANAPTQTLTGAKVDKSGNALTANSGGRRRLLAAAAL